MITSPSRVRLRLHVNRIRGTWGPCTLISAEVGNDSVVRIASFPCPDEDQGGTMSDLERRPTELQTHDDQANRKAGRRERAWGPFTGRQLTVMFCALMAAVVLLPGTVYAVDAFTNVA